MSGAPDGRRAATLATSVGSISLPNPVLTASGTSGHGVELSEYGALSELGAVVVKSLSVEPWAGNAAPRVHEVGAGMLNSVGLQGPGLAAWVADDLPALHECGARVVVSIWGRSVADYAKAAELVAAAASSGVGSCIAALEVNVSCPNVEDRSRMFAHSAEATARVLAATACGLPRWAKLSPNVPDVVEIAHGAVAGGADGLTLVNTLLGLALDIESGRPVLGAGGGGLSGGPCIRWRCAPCGSAGPPSRSCRSWVWAASSRATMRSSCWWPGPTPFRSARRPSGTPRRHGRCSANWPAGVTPGAPRSRASVRACAPASVTAPQRTGTRRPAPGVAVPSRHEGGRDG